MITQKKIKIPIFDYKLDIIIFDDWEELKKVAPDVSLHVDYARAITLTYPSLWKSVVAVDYKYASSITHEAEHVKNAIWKAIGYTPQADNDEVDAYLITYIYEKIAEVYYKHDKVSKG